MQKNGLLFIGTRLLQQSAIIPSQNLDIRRTKSKNEEPTYISYLGRVGRKPHETVTLDHKIPTGISSHFSKLIGELLEIGPTLRVQHPALNHDHVHIYRTDFWLRQPFALFQQLRHITRRNIIIWTFSVRQQFPNCDACKKPPPSVYKKPTWE